MQNLTLREQFQAATVFAAAAVAGAFFLSNMSSQGTSCSQIPSGSWFHAEYCDSQSRIAKRAEEQIPGQPSSALYAMLNRKN